MKSIFTFVMLLLSPLLWAQYTDEEILAEATRMQRQTTNDVINEGRRLYRTEQATWYAGDIFAAKIPEKTDDVGGYFSYEDSTGIKTVYFSQRATPTVIATIYFDTTLDMKTARFDNKERVFTPHEKQLYYIRYATITDITAHPEFYKQYNNTSLNLIPMVDSTYKRVYVMTGLKQSCLVIFGNDYVVTFDESNTLLNRQQIHKNIIPVTCTKGVEVQGAYGKGTSHGHNPETGDIPTATDICTLMLYAKHANWKQHTIYSHDNVSVWNCETNELTMMTRDEWKTKTAPPPPPKAKKAKTKKRK